MNKRAQNALKIAVSALTALTLTASSPGCTGPNSFGQEWEWIKKAAVNDMTPQWSPDGTTVIFENPSGTDESLSSVSIDGTNLRNLHDRPNPKKTSYMEYTHPDVSPDGSRIVLTTTAFLTDTKKYEQSDPNHPHRSFEIATLSTGKSEITRITRHKGHDIRPQWSPDGSQIAFARVMNPLGGPTNEDGIYTIRKDGQNPTMIADYEKIQEGKYIKHKLGPRWSPDGSQIAFALETEWVDENPNKRKAPKTEWRYQNFLYTASRDGSNLKTPYQTEELGNNYEYISAGPAWSPDGNRIAIAQVHHEIGKPSEVTTKLHVINMENQAEEIFGKIPAETWALLRNPSLEWHPTKEILLYAPGSPRWAKKVEDTLHLIDLENNEQWSIPKGGHHASWSPDGTRIAAIKNPSASQSQKEEIQPYLITMNLDGTGQEVLVTKDQNHKLRAANEKCFLWWCR